MKPAVGNETIMHANDTLCTINRWWFHTFYYLQRRRLLQKSGGGSKIINVSQRLKAINCLAQQRQFFFPLPPPPIFDTAHPGFSVLDFWVSKSTSLPTQITKYKTRIV